MQSKLFCCCAPLLCALLLSCAVCFGEPGDRPLLPLSCSSTLTVINPVGCIKVEDLLYHIARALSRLRASLLRVHSCSPGDMAMAGGSAPRLSNEERIKLFLEKEDWSLLEEPLLFKVKDNPPCSLFCRYIYLPNFCALPCLMLSRPMMVWTPKKVHGKIEGLYLDQMKVWEETAINDSCFHIRTFTGRQIFLAIVKEVYLEDSCWGSCDVNELVIKSNLSGNIGSMEVAGLEDKWLAKKCIDLAVMLHRQQGRQTTQLLTSMFTKGSGGGDSMQDRLKRLEALKQNSVLTEEEVAASKMHLLLQTDPDPTIRLQELGDLWMKQMVTLEEFMQMKAKILTADK